MPMSLHDVIPSENHLLDDVAILLAYFGADPKLGEQLLGRQPLPERPGEQPPLDRREPLGPREKPILITQFGKLGRDGFDGLRGELEFRYRPAGRADDVLSQEGLGIRGIRRYP